MMSWEDFLKAQKPSKGEKGLADMGATAADLKNHDGNKVAVGKVRVAEKVKDPLGDESTPSLKNPEDNMPYGKKMDYSNLTAEQFINETADMDNVEFIKNMLAENKKKVDSLDDLPRMTCRLTGNAIMPDSFEVARYMGRLAPHNEKAVRTFVRELLGTGSGMKVLIEALSGHPEVFDEIVAHMDSPGSKFPQKLVESMGNHHKSFMKDYMNFSEGVAVPVDERLPDYNSDEEDDEMNQDGLPKFDPNSDDQHPMGDEMPPNGNEDPMASFNGDAEQHPDLDGQPEPTPPANPNIKKMSSESPHSSFKFKRRFPHHHLATEMGKNPHMFAAMKEVTG